MDTPRRIEFWAAGDPIATPRPRARVINTPKGPQATIYIGHRHGGSKIRQWMATVTAAASRAAGHPQSPVWPRGAPLDVRVVLRLQRPLCHYRGSKSRDKPLKPTAPIAHMIVPDCDNLAKGVLDACSGILWHDDRQIARCDIWKLYTEGEPGVFLMVDSLTDERIERLNDEKQS